MENHGVSHLFVDYLGGDGRVNSAAGSAAGCHLMNAAFPPYSPARATMHASASISLPIFRFRFPFPFLLSISVSAFRFCLFLTQLVQVVKCLASSPIRFPLHVYIPERYVISAVCENTMRMRV